MTKIAFIGAGSLGFTRGLVRDILTFPLLEDAELALMDIDAERLDFSRAIADSSSIRAVRGGKKLDRTQPIAVVRAANTTSSRKHKASRLPSF